MEPILIQAEIKKLGGSMTAIAESLGVSSTSVREVIYGDAKSRRIAATIALFLGRSVDELWPDKYPPKYRRRSLDALLRMRGAAAIAKRTSKAA